MILPISRICTTTWVIVSLFEGASLVQTIVILSIWEYLSFVNLLSCHGTLNQTHHRSN
jgi:hypothetical protein